MENKTKKISLFSIDRILIGEASPEELAKLLPLIQDDPLSSEYIERSRALKTDLSFKKIQNLIETQEKHFGVEDLIRTLKEIISKCNAFKQFLPINALVTAVFFISIGTGYYLISSKKALNYNFKGNSETEVSLQVNKQQYDNGSVISAKTGDTLSFNYRSIDSQFVYLFYREDNGPAQHFNGDSVKIIWNASLTKISETQQILLDSGWDKQDIIVLTSNKEISIKKARSVINGSALRSIHFFEFHLVHNGL